MPIISQDHRKSRLDLPAKYRIMILGRIDPGWREWFDGMHIEVGKAVEGETVTTLTGMIQDQSALHGLLANIRDLCLPLLQVQILEDSCSNDSGNFISKENLKDIFDLKE